MQYVKKENRKKPTQPIGITEEELYQYAELYAKPVYDYSLNVLKEEFEAKYNTSSKMKLSELKSKKRFREKLEERDIGKNPSNILDIVRGTMSFDSVENLLDFIAFTLSFKFQPKHFDKFPNAKVKKHLQSNTLDMPVANFYLSNGFNFDINDDNKDAILKKYPFLSNEAHVKKNNYMDFKFYMYIPIPTFEDSVGLKKMNDFICCEVIATINDFLNQYDKTHDLYELTRKFEPLSTDDVDPKTFCSVISALSTTIHIDNVINGYNEAHPDSLHLKPYKDDKDSRLSILNSVQNSITLSNAICGIRNYQKGR